MVAIGEGPATYRQLFAISEFRAIFTAGVLSATGDMLAKVAIAVLVFDRTNSSLLSAAAFAISYLPSIIGGPFLATLADRLPWRCILVSSDLIRASLVAALALPGIPLWAMLIVLFTVALASAPFDAARVAMMPNVLKGDVYFLGVSALNVSYQASQIAGFAAGGMIVSLVSARGALLIDAATYLTSAVLLRWCVQRRPAPTTPQQRSGLISDTMAGFRLIMRHRTPRMLVLLAWIVSAFGFAHEGLAAPLARDLEADTTAVGLLLAASPVGMIIGGVIFTRLVGPVQRLRLLCPLALLSCAPLVLIVLPVPLPVVLTLYFISGVGMSFMLPLNAIFNRIMPSSHRGRTGGVVLAGLMAGQGLAILLGGWLADCWTTRSVIGVTGLMGLVAIVLIIRRWPRAGEINQPVAEAKSLTYIA